MKTFIINGHTLSQFLIVMMSFHLCELMKIIRIFSCGQDNASTITNSWTMILRPTIEI